MVLSIKVQGAYYTNMRIIFEFLRYILLVEGCSASLKIRCLVRKKKKKAQQKNIRVLLWVA